MQTATSTLATAIQSRERQPVARVTADWLRDGTYSFDPGIFRDEFSDTFEGAGDLGDLTPFIESVSIDRSLSTDLPDEVKLDTGYGAASASVVIAGNLGGTLGTTPITTAFTPYDNPLSALAARLTVPIRIDIGMRTSAGVETLRQFTGKIRSVSVDPQGGTVTLEALDRRADVQTPVTLAIRADGDPNLAAGVFMTEIVNAQTPAITASYETPQNTLLATPQLDTTDPWALLQMFADAEQGVILFDENGILRFYNRNHMVGGAAVATVTTTGTTANLKALASVETVDSVRNRVTVPAVPYTVDPPSTEIWKLTEELGVPANSGLDIAVDFDGVPYQIAAVAYDAQRNADGSGGSLVNLSVVLNQTGPTTFNMIVTNPNGVPAYLVDTIGVAHVIISGRLIRPVVDGYTAVRSDPASIVRYGTQPLDLSTNPLRQSNAAAAGLSTYLLSVLKDPHPTLSGVEVVGDPRLQLADRVRVTAPDGLVLDADFWLVGIQSSFSAGGGYTQSLTLRAA